MLNAVSTQIVCICSISDSRFQIKIIFPFYKTPESTSWTPLGFWWRPWLCPGPPQPVMWLSKRVVILWNLNLEDRGRVQELPCHLNQKVADLLHKKHIMRNVYIHLDTIAFVFWGGKQQVLCCCFCSLLVAKWWPLLWCCNAQSCSRRDTSATWIIQRHRCIANFIVKSPLLISLWISYRVHHRGEQRANIGKVRAGQRLSKALSQHIVVAADVSWCSWWQLMTADDSCW